MRTDRRSFRGAVAASVVLHAALAVALISLGRWHAGRPDPPQPPRIDTRVTDEPRIAVGFAEERAVEVVVNPDPPRPTEPPPPAPTPQPPSGSRPEVVRVPATLPSELLALMRKPQPVGPAVVEVPLNPTRLNPPTAPSPAPAPAPVRPAAHVSGSPVSASPPVRPVHGPLAAGRAIVYVLDASGSMGEWGKFARAGAAVVAALRLQPPTVRFQVVLYASTAAPPLPAPVGGSVAANEHNIDRVEEMLGRHPPAGRSDHAAGLREALKLHPDFVLILTDATDLPVAKFRGLLAQHGRPVTVCVAPVGAEGVGPPVEVK